jgi:hypothetical protein
LEVTVLLLLRELRLRRVSGEQDKRSCDDPIAHGVSCLEERLRRLDESF